VTLDLSCSHCFSCAASPVSKLLRAFGVITEGEELWMFIFANFEKKN